MTPVFATLTGSTCGRQAFYAPLAFRPRPEFLSLVVGEWLGNNANR